jgi:hypothetical protein
MELRGMRHDASMLGSTRLLKAGFENDLTLVLEGRWLDRRGGGEMLGAGEARWGPALPTLVDRWEPDARLLTVEWTGAVLDSFTTRRCSAAVLGAAEQYFCTLANERTRDDDLPSLRRMLEALAGEGAPVAMPPVLAPPPSAVRSAQMLNHALAHLSEAPAWVDFTSERSERQWRRDLAEAGEWLGLPGGTLRKTLNTIRLLFASSLMSIPDATTAEIAERLGYGTERALLLAMRRANIDVRALRAAGIEGPPTR